MRPAVRAATMLCVLAGVASAQDEAPASVSFESTVTSRYLWRGFVVNGSPSLQPAVTLRGAHFSLSSWHNFSRDVPHHQAWTEHDVSIEYSRQFGRVELTGGFAEFFYPDLRTDEGNRSREWCAGIAFELPLSPSFRYYRDFAAGHGAYWYAAIEKSWTLPRRIALKTSGGAGLNQHLYQAQTTVSNVDFTASLDIPVSRSAVVIPFFTAMAGHRSLFGRHSAAGLRLAIERPLFWRGH